MTPKSYNKHSKYPPPDKNSSVPDCLFWYDVTQGQGLPDLPHLGWGVAAWPHWRQESWTPLQPPRICSLHTPRSPALAGGDGCRKTLTPRKRWRTPALEQGHSWWGDSEHPAGAERSPGQRKRRSLGGFLSSQNNFSQAVSTIHS